MLTSSSMMFNTHPSVKISENIGFRVSYKSANENSLSYSPPHHILIIISVQTRMSFFLQWDTKEQIFLAPTDFHFSPDDGSRNCLVNNILHDIFILPFTK